MYFANKPCIRDGIFIQYFNASSVNLFWGYLRSDKYTLHSSLVEDDQLILGQFTKATLYSIRRSSQDPVRFKMDDDEASFIRCSDNFCDARVEYKGRKNIDLSIYKGHVVYNCCYFKEEPIIGHSYLVDDGAKKVMLLHSRSGINGIVDKSVRQIYGGANRQLHHLDMLYFKAKGYLIYDWGGIAYNTDNPKLQGINHFKMEFGGKLVRESNYVSVPLYLLRKLRSLQKILMKK